MEIMPIIRQTDRQTDRISLSICRFNTPHKRVTPRDFHTPGAARFFMSWR